MARLRLLLVLFALATTFAARTARADPPKLPAEEVAQGSTVPELTPPADDAMLGKTIARVEVVAEGDRWKTVPAVKGVKAGEPLTRDAARRAMRELLDTGRFARARTEATLENDRAVLRVVVVPRRLIQTIQIRGGALDREATLEAADLAEGGDITAVAFPDFEDTVRRFYVRHGFPDARVSIDATDTDDPAKVVLTLDIAAGAPRVIEQRVFVIDPKADAQVGPLKNKYRVGAGARVDEQALGDADRELGDLLRQNGFPRATTTHTTQRANGKTYLYIYVVPGPKLLPVFDGNRVFDTDQLSQAMALDKGEAKTADLVDRLRTYYIERGFLDVEVSATESGKDDDPVHYLTFKIVEHDQVRVAKRVFPCLPPTFAPNFVGGEIQSFLEEELPGADVLSPVDPKVVSGLFGPTRGTGGRGRPVALDPAATYAPETYEKALKHLRDIFHAKGYLNAIVGPVSVIRATCSKSSRAGECIPEPPPVRIGAQCVNDAAGVPIAEPPVPEELSCRPDPIRHIECSPEITLRIPLHLGPQSVLYDLAFEGNRAYSEVRLAKIADLPVGDPLSNLELEAARLRVLDRYRVDGYAYAEVRTNIEPSPDRTRARARFYVTERDKVIVEGFVIKGASRTDEALILRRVALKKNQPFKQDWARQSEERIATLGTFSSVSVGLEDADVPQKRKRVVITVVEQLPQYLDPRIGFSTGEGIRFAFEYGHRNIGGLAIAVTLRIQLSYLFDFMILDPQVKENYAPLSVGERLERRDTISIAFPEIGLGPLIGLTLDGIDVRDNQRDYGITKQAFVPTLTYRPWRQFNAQFGASTELNDVHIFNEDALNNTIQLLRAPEGRTIALAERFNVTWDARDNPFAATRGVLLSGGVEHVDAFPADIGDNVAVDKSHFLRFTGRVAGYVRLTQKGTSVAMSIAGGYNLQLTSSSKTYPDRLFFLGGVDSIRAFLADQMVPEDVAQRILHNALTIDQVAIRGGNLALNPRVELRVPITDLFATGIFLDTGNLWVDPSAVDLLALRFALGAGVRIATPIGPIALDYGINMLRRPWEDFGAFHFSIGLF